VKLTIDKWVEIGSPPVKIVLDGDEIREAVAADEEQGTVETYRKTDHGDYVLVGGGLDRVVLQGQVEIQFQTELSRKQAQSMLDRLEQR
jgi:hypothetical protein